MKIISDSTAQKKKNSLTEIIWT